MDLDQTFYSPVEELCLPSLFTVHIFLVLCLSDTHSISLQCNLGRSPANICIGVYKTHGSDASIRKNQTAQI